jgi:hypothetical protein
MNKEYCIYTFHNLTMMLMSKRKFLSMVYKYITSFMSKYNWLQYYGEKSQYIIKSSVTLKV